MKNKDFSYYGRKRLQVQRMLKCLEGFKINVVYIIVPLVLIGLIFDIQTNFSFSFTMTGGVLSVIFIMVLFTYLSMFIWFIVLSLLDKYYFKKRSELLEQYIANTRSKKHE